MLLRIFVIFLIAAAFFVGLLGLARAGASQAQLAMALAACAKSGKPLLGCKGLPPWDRGEHCEVQGKVIVCIGQVKAE